MSGHEPTRVSPGAPSAGAPQSPPRVVVQEAPPLGAARPRKRRPNDCACHTPPPPPMPRERGVIRPGAPTGRPKHAWRPGELAAVVGLGVVSLAAIGAAAVVIARRPPSPAPTRARADSVPPRA